MLTMPTQAVARKMQNAKEQNQEDGDDPKESYPARRAWSRFAVAAGMNLCHNSFSHYDLNHSKPRVWRSAGEVNSQRVKAV
jgi:hypothetical protein